MGISTYNATSTWLSRPIVQVQLSRESTVLIKTIYIFFICTLRALRSYNLFYQNIKRCKVRKLRLILAMHMYGYLGAGRLRRFHKISPDISCLPLPCWRTSNKSCIHLSYMMSINGHILMRIKCTRHSSPFLIDFGSRIIMRKLVMRN